MGLQRPRVAVKDFHKDVQLHNVVHNLFNLILQLLSCWFFRSGKSPKSVIKFLQDFLGLAGALALHSNLCAKAPSTGAACAARATAGATAGAAAATRAASTACTDASHCAEASRRWKHTQLTQLGQLEGSKVVVLTS